MSFSLLKLAVSIVALVLSAKVGDFLRRRASQSKEDSRDDFGVVLAGTLTLLGLLIGFSFSMAISRYDLRKANELAEANAIAVEYARADLLAAGDAARVHDLLKKYLDLRVLFYTMRDERSIPRIKTDTLQLQKELWSTIRSAVASVPPQREGLLLTGMSDVFIAQRSTEAAWWNRIPPAAWAMIGATSIGCSFLIGYRARRTDWLVFSVMPVSVTIAVLLIADLDSPRGDPIRVIPQNLISLSRDLRANQ